MLPRSAVARSNLALAYYMEGDLSAAREQAGFAISIEPEMAAARDIAGHCALELDDRASAIEHFRVLARLEPSNPDVHSNLGLAYYKDDRLGDAIEAYKRVLIFSPNSPEGHNDLGLAYARTSASRRPRPTSSRSSSGGRPTRRCIATSPRSLLQDDTEDAVGEWREVTRLSPALRPAARGDRFSAYDDQGMYIRPMIRSCGSSISPQDCRLPAQPAACVRRARLPARTPLARHRRLRAVAGADEGRAEGDPPALSSPDTAVPPR